MRVACEGNEMALHVVPRGVVATARPCWGGWPYPLVGCMVLTCWLKVKFLFFIGGHQTLSDLTWVRGLA